MFSDVLSPDEIHNDARRLRRAFILAATFASLLWWIKVVELVVGLDLSSYGIFPGRTSGLVGILLAPLIHSSVAHLLANTAPILVLGTGLLYGYPRAARIALPLIYVGSGIGVWLFARHAYHIGASGLAFGMMFFIFTIGASRWDKRAIALSLIVFLLYGSMIWGIFPTEPNVSFEYHFFGAVMGVILAILLRNLDPRPPEKKYSWEEEGEDGDDDWPTDEEVRRPDSF